MTRTTNQDLVRRLLDRPLAEPVDVGLVAACLDPDTRAALRAVVQGDVADAPSRPHRQPRPLGALVPAIVAAHDRDCDLPLRCECHPDLFLLRVHRAVDELPRWLLDRAIAVEAEVGADDEGTSLLVPMDVTGDPRFARVAADFQFVRLDPFRCPTWFSGADPDRAGIVIFHEPDAALFYVIGEPADFHDPGG